MHVHVGQLVREGEGKMCQRLRNTLELVTMGKQVKEEGRGVEVGE